MSLFTEIRDGLVGITKFVTGYAALEYVIGKLIPDIPDIPKIINENRVQSQLEPEWSRPVIYGETETAGNLVFYNVSDHGGEVGSSNSLDIVIDVCEGEIQGFEKVYMNDEPIPLFDAGTGNTFSHTTTYITTNPLYGALKASGTLVITGPNFVVNDYFIINGVNVVAGYNFTIGVDFNTSIDNLITFLNSSSNPNISSATYTASRFTVLGIGTAFINISWDTVGSVGNDKTYRFVKSGSNRDTVMRLSGGIDEYYAKATFYNGTDSQVSDYFLGLDYAGWDTNHSLPGAAYVIIRLAYNPDLFRGGIPQFKFKLKGKKVYDPRTSTTVYSTNPAICLRDYLLSTRYGKGLTSGDLNNQNIIDSANLCDVTRSGLDVTGGGVSYKSYEIGAIVDTKNTIKTNVEYFLQSMNGVLPYFDGQYYLNILGAGNATVILSESDIVGGISISTPSKKDKLNRVDVSFPDKARHYKVGEAPFINSTYYAEDGNEYLQRSVTAPYVDYYPRAKDLAELAVNMSRIKSGIAFTTTSKILQSIPGDIIGLTYDTLGWSAKEFRLNQITIRPDGLCDVVLTEHFDSFYALTQKQEIPIPNTTTLKSPYDVTKPIITSTRSDKTTHLVSVEGLVTPRILVEWSCAEEYVDQYIIYYKKSTETKFTVSGKIGKDDALAFYITNLTWGTQYDVGVQAVNGLGIKSQIAVSSYAVPNPLTEAIYNYPDVTGLELVGRGTDQGKGNDTTFEGKDIRLQWRLSSNNAVMEFGSINSEVIGGAGSIVPFTLKGYKVSVYHPGDIEPRQVYTVTDPHFTYSLDKNIEDGLGTPSRTVTFKVIAFGQIQGYGVKGESEIPAKLTATNPQPDLPTALNIDPNFQHIRVRYIRPSDADYKGIKVWLGTSTGFARNNATLAYDGPDNNIVLSGLISGGTYYLRLMAYDDFGEAGATESSEYTVTLPQAISGDEVTSLTISKITAGNLVEQVNVAGVFVATGTEAVINKTFTDSTWRAEFGPISSGGSTYILRYHNGTTTNFSIDAVGNAVFGGSLNAATGTFSGSLNAATGTLGALTINTNGHIKSGQTAYDTGTGFWIGDVSGTQKFSIGNSSGSKLTWDGTDLTVNTLKTSSGNVQRIELNPSSDNQLHFYGDNGNSVVEELSKIGIKLAGSDYYCGYFGSRTAGSYRNGLAGVSVSLTGVFGQSTTGTGVYGSANSGIGVLGDGGSYGVYGSSGGVGVYGFAATSNAIAIVAENPFTTKGAFKIVPKFNTTDPTSGSMGEFYVRSDGVLRFHNGTSWKTITVV